MRPVFCFVYGRPTFSRARISSTLAPDATTCLATFSASPGSSASQNARIAASSRGAGNGPCAERATADPRMARAASNRAHVMAGILRSAFAEGYGGDRTLQLRVHAGRFVAGACDVLDVGPLV